MVNRTAENVAEMESELHFLRDELERTKKDLAIAEADNKRLQLENVMLEGKGREDLVNSTRLETIMRQVSAGLIDGLKEAQQSREMRGAVRRQVQEEHEQQPDKPAFMLRTQPQPSNAGRSFVDPTLADRDSRIPRARDFEPVDTEETLMDIANNMTTKRG